LQTLSQSQVDAALNAAADADASPQERAEMLMEIAMSLQAAPKSAQQLLDAVGLYERALVLAPTEAALLKARITARMGTALQALPQDGDDAGAANLERALACFQGAIPTLQQGGKPEEVAEAELNQGLAQQSLSAMGRARITDAIAAYQRSLRTFTREAWPQEYSVLHNNLAIAYLSMPATDARGRMREALAVQSFEEVLKVINLIDHPSEYAMINNNLGNALQYASSGHVIENNLRALAAYDEALRVRNSRDTPLEYANTIANKANVLRYLVPDPAQAATGAADPARDALALVREAQALFQRFGDAHKATLMADSAAEIEAELAQRRQRMN
jgi:tetratricopeptide (TPR) repeat protein